MKNLLDKLLFLGAILCLALVLSGYTKEGFECEIKNYPNIYEDELFKDSKMDVEKAFRFANDELKEENKNRKHELFQ